MAQNDSQEYPPILESRKFPRIDVTDQDEGEDRSRSPRQTKQPILGSYKRDEHGLC